MIPPAPKALLHKLRTLDRPSLQPLNTATQVASPCISICKMDEARAYCVGCLRTLDELRAWGNADAATKREIWQRIRVRATTPSP